MMRHWVNGALRGSTLAPVATALWLALALAGCGPEEEVVEIDSEAVAVPSTVTLAQDSSYMARIFEARANGKPFINLSLDDERQYKFVLNRLLHAGKSPSNSPRLFQRLREIRAQHRAAFAAKSRAGGVKTSGEEPPSAAGGNGTKCGVFMITAGGKSSNLFTTNGSAFLTCKDGADYLYADYTGFKTNEAESPLQLLVSDYAETFGPAINMSSPQVHTGIVAGQGYVALNDTFAMGCDDTSGDCDLAYTKWKHDADSPATIGTISSGSTATLDPASCQLDHPRDVTGDGIVRLCYQRTYSQGNVDCDYCAVNAANQPGVPPFEYIAMLKNTGGVWAPSTTDRWPIPDAPVMAVPNLFIPLMGKWDAGTQSTSGQPCKTTGFTSTDTWAAVSLAGTGVWCAGTGRLTGTQLFDSLQANRSSVVPNTNKVPFGEDASTTSYIPTVLANFGIDCLAYLQDATLTINITAKTTCPDTPDKTRTATCKIAFDVKNSCFAEGTQIRRANGTTVAVEEIQVGDEILANGSGTWVTVTAASRGVEPEPMVRIKDNLGHELLLTSKHPVITTHGPVPADEITTMFQVETEDGIASVVEVERVRYQGQVYNLSVGTAEELALFTGANRTMFAGGIRVGDNEMQFAMEQQRRAKPHIQRPQSAAWEVDRQKAAARKQRALQK
jgi:hypothetical protein